MPSVVVTPRGSRTPWGWLLLAGVLAFGVRLGALLTRAGLYGRVGYDGSVYYASAAALAHGALPYRDFLLLHPPGISLELLPFAALGPLVGDADAYALARVAWCVLGGVSAALVLRLLRPHGLVAALGGAALYAVFLPAVTSERTTTLEGVGSVCLLGALVLLVLRPSEPSPARPAWRTRSRLLLAGALLGVATTTKIWGVALVVVLVAWTAWHDRHEQGVRRAGLVLGGAAAVVTLACLPFFVAAPSAMWRMVVLDQLGRPRVSASLLSRVLDVAGVSGLRGTVPTGVLALGVAVVGVVVLVLAVRDPLGRLAAVLLVVTGAVLLLTPPWSLAYAPLAAPAVVLLVGCALGRLAQVAGRRGPVVASVVAVVAVAVAGASLPAVDAGSRFPGKSLERLLSTVPGCVTTDDPIALIETGALQRNLDRGCPVVVDLSGYSWDLQPAASEHRSRPANTQWQRYALDHLATGDASVVVRFRKAGGFSASSRATIARWPLLGTAGPYEVRQPDRGSAGPSR